MMTRPAGLVWRLGAPALLALALAPGCGDDDDEGAAGSAGGGGACAAGQIASCTCANNALGEQTCLADGSGYGACNCPTPMAGCEPPVEEEHPIEGQQHIATCSARIAYGTNPPSSGDHYPQWAAYRTYRDPVPAEFLVHDLEHGAIVITYNCPGACPPNDAACAGGCEAAIADAEALAAAYGPDPLCVAPVRSRLIVTPLPSLDVPFAASSWGHTLRAGCFDRAAFLRFIDAHYAQGRENICNDGIDPFASGPNACPGLPPLTCFGRRRGPAGPRKTAQKSPPATPGRPRPGRKRKALDAWVPLRYCLSAWVGTQRKGLMLHFP